MAKEKILDIIKSSKTIDSAYDIKLNKGQGTNAASATRKDYVDSQDALKVNKAGDTMTGNLITSGALVADGVIRTKYSVETYDTTSTYGIRDTILGSAAYIQAGKVDRDVADQKLILSGWLGTPLTMLKFSMANGVNPQVTWGSTNHDILHRGNLPNAADVGAVSKTGDVMTGDLRFSQEKTGITLHPTAAVTGIYNGTGDAATQDATNIQIKSWYGVGIAPTAGLLPSMTLGQNSVWINARTGDIETIGKTTQNRVVIKGNAPSNYFIETDSATQKTYIQVVDGDSFRLHEDNTGITEANLIFRARGTDKRFEIRNPVSSTAQISDINALTRKDYVDSEILKQVAKTGDTMTGNLTVPTVLLSNSQSNLINSTTRKDYVDGEIAKQVAKTGDTMTGVLTVGAEVRSTLSNSYRLLNGTSSIYGTFWRNDGANLYLMLTNANDALGNYNALRPFIVSLNTGITTLSADSCIANSTQKIFHDKYAPRITQSEYLDTGSDLNNMAMYTGGLTISRFGSGVANRPTVVNSANTILGINPITGYKHQLVFSSDGKMYNRYNDNVSWSDWGQVYTSIYRPTPAEVGAVNKTGDTMTGNLSFSDTGEGVRFAAFNSGSGIYNGTGDGASQDATNIQIKSWQGIGISPTAGLPSGMTMGQNSIWIDARIGDITTIGSVNSNGLYLKNVTSNTYTYFDAIPTKEAGIRFRNNGLDRWKLYQNITTESGGNSGSDFVLNAYSDTGSLLATAITVTRSDQVTKFLKVPIVSSAQGTEVNSLTRKDYVDGQVAALLARIVALESK